jgi:hypothetical protein
VNKKLRRKFFPIDDNHIHVQCSLCKFFQQIIRDILDIHRKQSERIVGKREKNPGPVSMCSASGV